MRSSKYQIHRSAMRCLSENPYPFENLTNYSIVYLFVLADAAIAAAFGEHLEAMDAHVNHVKMRSIDQHFVLHPTARHIFS